MQQRALSDPSRARCAPDPGPRATCVVSAAGAASCAVSRSRIWPVCQRVGGGGGGWTRITCMRGWMVGGGDGGGCLWRLVSAPLTHACSGPTAGQFARQGVRSGLCAGNAVACALNPPDRPPPSGRRSRPALRALPVLSRAPFSLATLSHCSGPTAGSGCGTALFLCLLPTRPRRRARTAGRLWQKGPPRACGPHTRHPQD